MSEDKKMMEEHTLKKGEVGLWHGVFLSFSFVAPAGDVAILLVGTVAFAGEYTGISVILAWLIYGLFMITRYEFSKIKANVESYYAYSIARDGILLPKLVAFVHPKYRTLSHAPLLWLSLESTISQIILRPKSLNFAYFGATLGGVIWSLIGCIISYYYISKKSDILAKAGNYDAEREVK